MVYRMSPRTTGAIQENHVLNRGDREGRGNKKPTLFHYKATPSYGGQKGIPEVRPKKDRHV